jgi:hypothetical protein
VVVAVPLCTRLPLALGVWGLGFRVWVSFAHMQHQKENNKAKNKEDK